MIPDLTNSYLDKGQSEQVSIYDIWGDNSMPYPHSKYQDGADGEVHIRDFVKTSEINHAAQRLSSTAEDKSKLLSLNCPWMVSERSIRSNNLLLDSYNCFIDRSHRKI